MMKKFLHVVPLFAAALMISFAAGAQQSTTEEVAYELPAMISPKTVPLFDDAFANMPGVKITMYCFNLNLVVFTVERNKVADNTTIEQKIHGIFHTDNTMLKLEPLQSFKRANYTVMCNEQDLITR